MSAPITAAAIISFSERLQEVSAAFYRALDGTIDFHHIVGIRQYARYDEYVAVANGLPEVRAIGS